MVSENPVGPIGAEFAPHQPDCAALGPLSGSLSDVFSVSPEEFAQMQQEQARLEAAGFTVDPSGLASRVGELRAVADAVGSAAAALDVSGGDLGPDDLAGAVHDLRSQWLDGLGRMRGKIGDMATAINTAGANYVNVENASQESFGRNFGASG